MRVNSVAFGELVGPVIRLKPTRPDVLQEAVAVSRLQVPDKPGQEHNFVVHLRYQLDTSPLTTTQPRMKFWCANFSSPDEFVNSVTIPDSNLGEAKNLIASQVVACLGGDDIEQFRKAVYPGSLAQEPPRVQELMADTLKLRQILLRTSKRPLF